MTLLPTPQPSQFQPLAWQDDCQAALDSAFAAGHRSALVQSATGTGKTVMFEYWLANALRDGGRALIVVDQRKLAYQALDKLRMFFPHLAAQAGIVMSELNETRARVVIATRQTLAARNGRRLKHVLAHGEFTHYVVDEAHGDLAEQFRFIERALREANPQLLKTGWTATPYPSAGGLVTVGKHRGVYDVQAFSYPTTKAIRDGTLCPFKAFAVGLDVSFAGLDSGGEDWDSDSIADLLDVENVWEIVLATWRGEHEDAPDCSGKRTLVFTASVAQAKHGAEYFRARGVPAEYAHGGTPDDERRAIERRFHDGETLVLFNCMLYTVGFDEPRAEVAFQCAPTRSTLLWVQKMGRVLRRDPDNPDKEALLVDFYPLERDNVFAAEALGIPKTARQAKERAEDNGVLVSFSIDNLGRAAAIHMSAVVVKALDLMAKSGRPWSLSEDLLMSAQLAEDSAAAIALPDPERLERANELRGTEAWTPVSQAWLEFISAPRLYHVEKNGRGWCANLEGRMPVEDAKAVVDTWPHDQNLGNRKAPWRQKPASPGQLRFLQSLGVADLPADTRMGEASQRINEALVTRAVERAEREQWARLKAELTQL